MTRTSSAGTCAGTGRRASQLVDDGLDAPRAPQVRRLRQQHGRQPRLDVRELRRQRVDGNDLHGGPAPARAGRCCQLAQQRPRVQRPAADHRPAARCPGAPRRARITVALASSGVSTWKKVPTTLMSGWRAASCSTPSTRRRRLGAARLPASTATCAPRGTSRASSAIIVSPALKSSTPHVREALRIGRVAVERHHRHAVRDRVVDRRRQRQRVRARQQHRVHAVPSSPARCARACTLPSLLRRRQPFDLDRPRPAAADSSRARVSAPRRAATNDGLLALLAIIAMRSGRWAAAGAAGAGGVASGAAASRARGSRRRRSRRPRPNPPRRRTAPCSLAPRPKVFPRVHERRSATSTGVARAPC